MKHPTLFTLALSFCLTAASAAEKKPNILFLFADDWGRYASILRGSEGTGTINDVVETPNFDRIAAEAATRAVANAARTRHELVVRFLLAVGLDPETAEADAEGLEHHASEKALAGFARFIKAQEGGGR